MNARVVSLNNVRIITEASNDSRWKWDRPRLNSWAGRQLGPFPLCCKHFWNPYGRAFGCSKVFPEVFSAALFVNEQFEFRTTQKRKSKIELHKLLKRGSYDVFSSSLFCVLSDFGLFIYRSNCQREFFLRVCFFAIGVCSLSLVYALSLSLLENDHTVGFPLGNCLFECFLKRSTLTKQLKKVFNQI